jgi:TetR/AcrR family tetracycline transcriptional repressor
MAKVDDPPVSSPRRGENGGRPASTGTAAVALSDRAVVAAARRIVAEEGVDGLTMRRLSNELGVTLGATYRHVPSKRDVLLLLARDLYGEARMPAVGTWDERIKRLMVDVARIMSAHPGMATFISANAAETLPAELHNTVVDVLRGAGFTKQGIDTVVAALFFYVHGIVASGVISARDGSVPQARVRTLVERGLDLLLTGAQVTLLDR